MEVNKLDSFERIEKIAALIEAHPEGISGQALAAACGVPWGTLKQDLKVLVSSETTIPLFTDCDENDSDESIFQPDVKWFMASVEKCYTPVHLNVQEALGVLNALDFVKEANVLKEALRQKVLSGFDLQEEVYRYVKGELTPLDPIPGSRLLMIENAIRQSKRLVITFNHREITVDPLGIVYYSRLRHWYLAARDGDTIKTYHFSNIRQVAETKETFVYPEGFSLKAWFGPRWGVEYGELIHVKVRFLNRSQTISKLRKDVAHRSSEITALEDGSVLFEDNIIGVNEFITWILGFGSAAEILEPVEFRRLILERVRETLGNY